MRGWAVLAAMGVAGAAAAWVGYTRNPSLPLARLGEWAALLAVAGAGAAILARGPHSQPRTETRTRFGRDAALLAVVAGLVYGWVLRLDFFADDFFNLTLAVERGWSLYRPQPGWHHFFPLGMDLNAAPYYIDGWTPFWFHLHQLLVAWLTALAVVVFARQWTTGPRTATIAGVLWLTFPLQVEGIAWVNILQYTYSALFAVIGATAFTRYLTTGARAGAVLCAVCAAASMLCLEQGAVLGLLCCAIAWVRRAGLRERSPAGVALALAAPFAVTGALLLWKRIGAGQLGYAGVGPAEWLRTWCGVGWSLLTPGSPAGLHVGLALAHRGLLTMLVGSCGALGLAALVQWRGGPLRTLGVLWAGIAVLPIVFGSPSIGSRHYLLPAVGVALVLAGWFEEAEAGPARRARGWVLLCVCVWGVLWIREWRGDFVRGADVVRQVHQDLTASVDPAVPYDRVALVDLPWGVGDGEWPALTFSTGGRMLVGWVRGDHDLDAVRAVRIWRTGPPGHTASEADFVDADTLAAAVGDPSQVVLQWEVATGRLVRLGAPLP